jgi:hypothetical protein
MGQQPVHQAGAPSHVLGENDWNRTIQEIRFVRRTIRTGFSDTEDTLPVRRAELSHCSRVLCCLVLAAFAVPLSGASMPVFPWGLATLAEAGTPERAATDTGHSSAHGDDEMIWFSVDDLPPGETYAALQWIRYLPGAHLAEQPSDGPKLLNILSGGLTIRAPVSGVVLSRPSTEERLTLAVEPGVDQIVNPGTIVMIPTGIPVHLSNSSETSVEWIQFRIETPSTLCACGENRSGIMMDLLASHVLPEPFLLPADVSLTRNRLDPGSEIPAATPGTIQIVGTVGDDATVLKRDDGSARNEGTEAIDVFVATVASQDPADPAQ